MNNYTFSSSFLRHKDLYLNRIASCLNGNNDETSVADLFVFSQTPHSGTYWTKFYHTVLYADGENPQEFSADDLEVYTTLYSYLEAFGEEHRVEKRYNLYFKSPVIPEKTLYHNLILDERKLYVS